MNLDALRKHYGNEYPAAVVFNGLRIPLTREMRFSRSFRSENPRHELIVSRFMDGSASITFAELEREWAGWMKHERLDFCGACSWLHEQADFPEMLRFIMQHSGPDEWSTIAQSIACHLPQREAFDFFDRALNTMPIGTRSNIGQAIAMTKHPDAERTLRNQLQAAWAHSRLWEHDHFINWVALEAINCIKHLIEIGAPPGDFEEQVRQLSCHACPGNRDTCRGYLSKHYSWLGDTMSGSR